MSAPALKAFAICNVIYPGPGTVAYYSATSASRAKARAASVLFDIGPDYKSAWAGLKCRRAPEFDGPELNGCDEAHAREVKFLHDKFYGGSSHSNDREPTSGKVSFCEVGPYEFSVCWQGKSVGRVMLVRAGRWAARNPGRAWVSGFTDRESAANALILAHQGPVREEGR